MKKVDRIIKAPRGHWVGDGFPVRTMFSYDSLGQAISPFLLLDYAGPAEFDPADRPRGVGEHPHRGFETVTIVYQGRLEHGDSAGNRGQIGPGDVQWMTAGAGVVHEEFHESEFTRTGGVFEVVQLWVNLPAKHKMAPPKYQTLLSRDIPTVALPGGGTARIIAGEFSGRRGPAETFTPVNLSDLRFGAGDRGTLALPPGQTSAIFVLRGGLSLEDAVLNEAEMALFDRTGGVVRYSAASDTIALFLSGEPIAEPIVGRGPFVMNTEAEIRQAIIDFQAGRMGQIAAATR